MDFTTIRCRHCFLGLDQKDFCYVAGIGCLHLKYYCRFCKRSVFMPFEPDLDIPTVKSKKLEEFESGQKQQRLF